MKTLKEVNMIEIKFTKDDDLDDKDIKCILAFRDFPSAIWDLKELMRNFWETSGSGKTEQEVEEFNRRFYEILEGLPELD